ncbi:hypothetical protein BH09ACT10_BH09ACT10_01970 [soil metagenome]
MRPSPSDLYAETRDLVAEAVSTFGVHATVDTALALLDGSTDYERLVVPLTYLGGASAYRHLERGDLAHRNQGHWPRVWAARSFLYVWLDYAAPTVTAGLQDEHWRVRETCVKVVAARHIDLSTDALLACIHDPEPRVQIAALRAAATVGDERHRMLAEGLTSEDLPREVSIAALSAERSLRRRKVSDG